MSAPQAVDKARGGAGQAATAVNVALDNPRLAQFYEEASASRQFRMGKEFVADLGIRRGQRVLDVGCGTGLLAEHVADEVGPEGEVAGIDPLPLRIELARRRARANLRFQVGNAYDLSRFAGNSFDTVYLNAVFHWLPEKLEPLRQFHRVLKPGGVLGFTAASKENPFPFQAIRDKVLAREPYSQYRRDAVGIVHPDTPAELEELFGQVGFVPRKLEIRPRAFEPWATAAQAIEFFEASSFGTFLGKLPPELHQQARQEIERELELLRTPQGIVLQGSGIVAVAVKA